MSKKLRQGLMVTCSLICTFYIVYRGLYTLNTGSWYATGASWLLYLAEIWGCVSLVLFFMQVWDPEEPPEQPPLEDAEVDVFVPSYDEDIAILRGTLQACLAMDYPHRTFLLDDGGREEVKQLCEELGVHYKTRENNLHAKAGNLNHALDQTDGEFIAILDADHVPEPNYLSRMIGYFRNPEVGMVQSPHAFSNFDTFQGRVNYEKQRFWDEGLLFYKIIQPGRNNTNSVIFAGSAAVFRRKALKDVGYIATETITEDMHTGMRLSAAGWRTVYVSERLIAGQGAADVTTFHSQRMRWAEGNLSILKFDNPLTMRGLDLKQRLTYFASIVHWAGGVPRLVLYITPVMMLLSGVSPVREFTPFLAAVFLAYIGSVMFTLRVIYRGYTNYSLVEFFNMANYWTQIRAFWRVIFPSQKARFVVTKKRGGRQGAVLPHIVPQIILLAVMWAALIYGVVSHLLFDPQLDLIGLGIATFLVLHHSRYAISYLRCAMAPASQRITYRHRVNLPVEYEFKDEEGKLYQGMGVTSDLSDMGIGMVAYSSLPTNVRGKITVIVNSDRLEADAVIRYAAHREGEATRGMDVPALFRYGLEFTDPAPETLDAAGRIAQRYAVAPWYSVFERNRESGFRRPHISHREVAREEFKLPVTLKLGDEEVHCTTRDLSIRAMRCILATPLDEEATYEAEVVSPVGTIHVTAKASDARMITEPPHSVVEYVMVFDEFHGQGRSMMQSLIDLGAQPVLRSSLDLSHEMPPRPYSRPVLAGALTVAAFSPIAIGLFHEVHDDDLLLASGNGEEILEADDIRPEDLDRILADTLATPNPERRRLLLLKDALEESGRNGDLVRVCRVLTARDPQDPNMGMALVSALTRAGRGREAHETSEAWIVRLARVNPDDPNLLTFQVLQARNTLVDGDAYAALDLFRRALAQFPDDLTTRKEYAGLLLQVGLADEALRQYSTLPQTFEVRLELISIYNSLLMFDASEQMIRELLRERPSDRGLQLELGNLLTWQKRFEDAQRVYRDLLAETPYDLEIRMLLAETMTWSGEADEALAEYGRMIDEGHDENDGDWRLLSGFLDAYLGADRRSKSDTRRLLWMVSLYDHSVAQRPEIPGRLATALALAGDHERALVMLRTAVEEDPTDRDLRVRLADALSAAGKHDEAQHHYRALLAEVRGGRKLRGGQ
ncbi:MAG: glycosyltransferase [Planctomycetota bacterium]|nr:glycosyltransferase [Planctomycetota bacterium]MDP6989207.1 glycosyltransferase [Planctomycetota bacterium]